MQNAFTISKDKFELDVAAIHDYLSNRSYWARGRSLATVQKSIEHSLCFGVYGKGGQLVGFARVVTDFTIFGHLMDLFILEEYRGQGLGKWLVKEIVTDPELQDIRLWRLDTRDAHGLYRKFGFGEPAFPEKMMEKRTDRD